jgi:hypothetical protein
VIVVRAVVIVVSEDLAFDRSAMADSIRVRHLRVHFLESAH